MLGLVLVLSSVVFLTFLYPLLFLIQAADSILPKPSSDPSLSPTDAYWSALTSGTVAHVIFFGVTILYGLLYFLILFFCASGCGAVLGANECGLT